MTTLETRPAPATTASVGGRRLAALGGFALIAGTITYTVGMAVSPPQTSEAAADYIASLAADPTMTQLSAVLLHVGNLLLALGYLTVPWLVRGTRGGMLALVGALMATLNHAVVSGWVLYDFWTMAIGRELDPATALELYQSVQSAPGFAVLSIIPILGLVAVPLATAGLARAGVTPWWLLAFAVVPIIAMMAIPFVPVLHATLTVASLVPAVWIAVVVLRRTRVERRTEA